ncbi:MAG: hypothetical protein ACYCUG_17900 [Acidimicrobiales bacterium]
MTLFRTTARKLAAGAIAGVTVLGGGAAVYAASTPAGTVTASTAATVHFTHRHHRHHRHPVVRGFFGGADHVTAEVPRNGSWVTLDWDRGTVTSFANGSLTLLRPDKQSVTFTITATTHFRGRSTTNLAGDRARVVSDSSGSALVVSLAPPLTAAPSTPSTSKAPSTGA